MRGEPEQWAAEFYLDADGSVPAEAFLDACPVGDRLLAIVEAVRGSPPPMFPPSQMWHVMTGQMRGIYEARARHKKLLHRLFCLLDANAQSYGSEAPTLTMLGGGTKPVGKEMDSDVYEEIVAFRDRYLRTNPRPIQQ
jgi:hypothetical protein